MNIEFIEIESFTSEKVCISASKKYKAHIANGYNENMIPELFKAEQLNWTFGCLEHPTEDTENNFAPKNFKHYSLSQNLL
tara:strand:- start:475 stop:714 length:240 start_codon:yes stop_codon:yes gene_type:complete